jgi:hypothetical protein
MSAPCLSFPYFPSSVVWSSSVPTPQTVEHDRADVATMLVNPMFGPIVVSPTTGRLSVDMSGIELESMPARRRVGVASADDAPPAAPAPPAPNAPAPPAPNAPNAHVPTVIGKKQPSHAEQQMAKPAVVQISGNNPLFAAAAALSLGGGSGPTAVAPAAIKLRAPRASTVAFLAHQPTAESRFEQFEDEEDEAEGRADAPSRYHFTPAAAVPLPPTVEASTAAAGTSIIAAIQ